VSAWVPRLALGAIAALVIGIVISIAVGEGGPQPRGVSGASDVQRIFGGIAQDGAELGPGDAEVTVSIFNDLQCTSCAAYQLDTVEPLVEGYARPGHARLVLRHFSIGSRPTTLAALAATAAGEQGYQWQFADVFVRNQDLAAEGGVTEELLREVGEAVLGLDASEWEAALDDPAVAQRVEADAELAAELRFPAEPAIVVDGPGGQRTLTQSPSLAEIEAAIAAVN
jgi:protein-disulfide isomerase